ncbi:CLUMA_CG011693, isoform A [Clunio marinus]|uniref:CLUMA_CG011693, isoform A n=1 Tax=Clunio marinus TaxID=568069 RepID=A0A1J1IDN6_9DIPT|nr:CLUMA_CG011693, isoform A [Clunio marinus]
MQLIIKDITLIHVDGITFGKIIAPSVYTALSEDFTVEFQTTEIVSQALSLKVSYLGPTTQFRNVGSINFYTDEQSNSTRFKVPCSLFTRAGPYTLHVEDSAISSTLTTNNNHLLEHKLDVRWPDAKLSVTHEVIETYPTDTVNAVIEFIDFECPVDTTTFEEVPSFQLELIYCGTYNVMCDSRSVPSNSTFPIQSIYGMQRSQADWSTQYILNIMDIKSTYDCVTGIAVVVKYPACIMDDDRVRLYGKLPADVHSIAKPSSLVYVSERKIERGQHSVYFNCELFVGRFLEYCFVYVTKSKTGAVADIRMDCVPTSPIYGPVDGKWGKWSNWSKCSSKYSYGTQIRYRFCDSPTPKYNGKYCEGASTETRPCSGTVSNIWEYFFGRKIFGTINSTEIMEEVGPSCQCGCIIHLLKSKPRRMLASSSQGCFGFENVLWTGQVEEGQQIQFNLEYFVLPCPTQNIKIRDGKDPWMSELIGEYSGRGVHFSGNVVSSGNLVLIEFHMNDSQIVNTACYAGFIGYVEVIDPPNVTIMAESSIMGMLGKDRTITQLNLIHFFVFLFCGILLLLSVFLGTQYVFRYHRYQLAKSKEEAESPLNTPHGSTVSISKNPQNGTLRATSTSTLISEVVTLVKLKPKTSSIKHKKLRESVVSQDFEKDQLNDCDSIGNYSNIGSTNTLTNDVKEEMTPIMLKKKAHSAPESDTSSSIYNATPIPLKKKLSLDASSKEKEDSPVPVEWTKEKCQKLQEKDFDETSDKDRDKVTALSTEAALTSGNYSPALSLTSTARIRLNNLKENKEKKNREKLMANPGSQYSLSTQEEMEMDYYDYNVINASAAPGSYLGMDPAFLVWIPPIDDNGKILSDSETDGDEILPVNEYIDPGSNKESPDEEDVLRIPPKPPRKSLKSPSCDEAKAITSRSLSPKEILSKINFLQRKVSEKPTTGVQIENIGNKKPEVKRSSAIEKETSVIKSPSDNKISEYYELSDIKFADDEEENLDSSYQDTTFQVKS